MTDPRDTISPHGRWGGRLTSRPLPLGADASIDALGDGVRAEIVETWLGASASERRAAESFAVIAEATRALDLPEPLRATLERAADDELRHAELCRVVAERYAGVSLQAPARLSLHVPKLEGASDRLRPTLFIVGQCALNETTASAYLDAALGEAKTPLARAALRELLSDEVEHARLGWAHLASLGEAERREVSRFVDAMIVANVREWRRSRRTSAHASEIAAHGAISPESVERAVMEAQSTLVLPGFARVGIDAGRARAWIERGCPA